MCQSIHEIAALAKRYNLYPEYSHVCSCTNNNGDHTFELKQLFHALDGAGAINFFYDRWDTILNGTSNEYIRDIIESEDLTLEEIFTYFCNVNNTDFGERHIYTEFLLGYIFDKYKLPRNEWIYKLEQKFERSLE